MTAAKDQNVGALILRYQELDSALRGLAVEGSELPPHVLDERAELAAQLKALGVDPAAGGEDVFGTLSDAEPEVSVLPVSKPPPR
jgi:hypothetical protein